jgi:SAM-dependent methyltransferase
MTSSTDDPSPPSPRRTPADFETAYAGTPPWDIGRPQPEFLALADTGGLAGRVLDVGCGTGEHALMAAERGHDVTGLDAAPTAIERARRKAVERGLSARFVLGDALALQELGESFDTVLDCGLFHVFSDADRVRYADSLASVSPPGSRLHVLCFSDEVPPGPGPRRVRREELVACFSGGWDVVEIRPAVLEVITEVGRIPAWHASLVRSGVAL